MERKNEASGSESRNSKITVTVKFSGRTIPVEVFVDSTVKDLKSILQPLTNVLPRGQKLISKGRVLVDEMTLRSLEITDGSKIMLMATQGLHQGDGPIKKEAPAVATMKRSVEMPEQKNEKTHVSLGMDQVSRWKATGVIALSGRNLKVVPPEVWSRGTSGRVLDLSHNLIQDLPGRIGCLTSIQKLLLDANYISDESICWEGLASLKSLATLSLNQNQLTSIPSSLGALTCLTKLEIANNEITCLPTEIGLLTKLEVLKANKNRLYTIPETIGGCISLVEVDLSANLLVELPETFGGLKDLKSLMLNNNGLRSLPTSLFKMCGQLSTLNVHGTQITMDVLRQIEGWEEFDNRRRLKLGKQFDFRVSNSGNFDEGADKS